MAINPSFNGYSLQSENVITERIEFRTRAKKRLELAEMARRMGKKLIANQLQEKVIQISGRILADTQSDLQSAIDQFHLQLSQNEKQLIIEGSRAYTATVERLSIPDQAYNQTIVPFDVQFVCSEGFSEDSQLSAIVVIPSGTNTKTFGVTISGSVTNRPQFRFVLPSGTGTAPISRIQLTNITTGNSVTVSGTFSFGDEITMDFDNFQVTRSGSIYDYVGSMDDIEPGSNQFTATASGNNTGTQVNLLYNPRYY